MLSESAILLSRGGATVPEGASIFLEGDIMHSEGGVSHTEDGIISCDITLFDVAQNGVKGFAAPAKPLSRRWLGIGGKGEEVAFEPDYGGGVPSYGCRTAVLQRAMKKRMNELDGDNIP